VAWRYFQVNRERKMAIAEGRTIPFVGPEHIDVAVLETYRL
jgi:hypothetical protein